MTIRDPIFLAQDLRKRIAKGDFALGKGELLRIAAMLEKLAMRCGEAYQVVGSLAGDCDAFDDAAVVRALDLLGDPMRRGYITPFITARDRLSARAKREERANTSASCRAGKKGRRRRRL